MIFLMLLDVSDDAMFVNYDKIFDIEGW